MISMLSCNDHMQCTHRIPKDETHMGQQIQIPTN